MKNTLNTINYGEIRILKHEDFNNEQKTEIIQDSDGMNYEIKIAYNCEIIAIPLDDTYDYYNDGYYNE